MSSFEIFTAVIVQILVVWLMCPLKGPFQYSSFSFVIWGSFFLTTRQLDLMTSFLTICLHNLPIFWTRTIGSWRKRQHVPPKPRYLLCSVNPEERYPKIFNVCNINLYLWSISVSLFPVVPTLEHGASLKRFVSLQFLNPKTVGLLGRGISPSQDRYIYKQNKRTQTSMPWMGFEPMNPAFERAKTIQALDRAATVFGIC
jgi:hypothetical protein